MLTNILIIGFFTFSGSTVSDELILFVENYPTDFFPAKLSDSVFASFSDKPHLLENFVSLDKLAL